MSWYNPSSWFKKPRNDNTPNDKSAFAEPPTGANGFAGRFPQFKDPVYRLNRKAFESIRRTDICAQPMDKVAKRIGMMTPTVVGRGERMLEVQQILDQARGMPDGLEWLAWGDIEGWRALYIQDYAVKERGIVAPDFRGGGMMRWQAGGTCMWDGWDDDNIVRVSQPELKGADPQKADEVTLDRERIVLFRPGAGVSPEGDLDRAWELYLLAEASSLLDKAMRIYGERHSIPREILKVMTDQLRPDELNNALQSAADKLAAVNAYHISSMPTDQILDYLEPTGTTWQFLIQYRRVLEGRAHKIITGENLTSDSTGSGPSGSSQNAQLQLDVAALALARKISESLTHDLLPWIERKNKGRLSPLAEDEPMLYIQLRPAVEKTRLSIGEAVQLMDRGWAFPTDYICELAGHGRIFDSPDVFVPSKASAPTDGGAPETQPDGTPNRPDRGPEDQQVRKQVPEEDLRNVKKNDEKSVTGT